MSSSEWNTYKIGDLCQITSSKRIFSEEYVDIGIPFYRSKEIIEKELGENASEVIFIPELRFKEIKAKFGAPQNGDILLSSVGNRSGIPYLVKEFDGDFYFKDGNLTWFKDFNDTLHSGYLYQWLRSPIGQNALNSIMIGSAQKALTIVGLSNLLIDLPSYSTQRHIVKILSALDQKIELNRQTNASLEAIAQAIFEEWFVDFNFPGAPSSGSGGELIESELGLIPSGWRLGTLGEILEIKGGTTPSTQEPKFWDGEHHWATPKDLSNLQSPILLTTERRITADGVRQISSGILPAGTLLLSSRAPIGYLAIAQMPISINQGFIAINAQETSNLFILHWLKENMDLVVSRANGSTFLEISKSNFREIELVIPDTRIAQLFEDITSSIYEQIKTNEQESITLAAIRNELLPKLINGEIDL